MRLLIDHKQIKGHINPEVQGQFSEHLGHCIYDGVYVGENNTEIPNVNGMRTDVVEALRQIKLPVLRWPGGCFADEYHWQDGIGPKEKRKKMVNTNWGGVVEDNSFGTEEYMELCRQIGCKTYVNGNLGSGTVREMSEWVEYMTFNGTSPMAEQRANNGHPEPYTVDYFGVGNENWGGGGNMTPEYYANLYRHYQTFLRNYDPKKPIKKIACGSDGTDMEWPDKVLKICFDSQEQFHGFMDGISLHYYTIPGDWDHKGSATDFTDKEWYVTLSKCLEIENRISINEAILDKYDKNNKVGLMVDEWGTWFDCEPGTNPGFLYQQNTVRDALVAGLHLNIFNKHCRRVKMANIAQLANVLQAMVLTDGRKMIKTPTYHVFDMYKYHQDADLVHSHIDTEKIGLEDEWMVPNLQESVSIDKDGKIHITICNLSIDKSYDIDTVLADGNLNIVSGEIVGGEIHEHNTFDDPERITKKEFNGYKKDGDKYIITIPSASVIHLTAEAK